MGVVLWLFLNLVVLEILRADSDWFSSIITLLQYSTIFLQFTFAKIIKYEKVFHFRILSQNGLFHHLWKVIKPPCVISSHECDFLRVLFHPILFCNVDILYLVCITCKRKENNDCDVFCNMYDIMMSINIMCTNKIVTVLFNRSRTYNYP